MDKHYYSENLDEYLSNRLSETEKELFEQLIQQDPVLKQDFEIQKETVHQLQDLRKTQIKTRLSSINVHEGNRHQLTRWIWLSGAAAVLLTGVFSWNLLNTSLVTPETTTSASALIQTPILEEERASNQYEEAISNSPAEDKDEQVEYAESTNETPVFQVVPVYYTPTTTKTALKEEASKEEERIKEVTPTDEAVLQFYYPDEEERDNFNFDIKEEDELKGVIDGSLSPTLEEQYAQNQLRYQHYDEHVFSNADFRFSPITINVGKQQKTFVYHEGYFYEILPNQYEQKKASKVHNRALIDRLRVELEKQLDK